MRVIKNRLKTLISVSIITFGILCCPIISKAAQDISKGNVNCTKEGGTYEVEGSTSKNNITVKGKSIKLYLNNVTIDLLNENNDEKSQEKSAIYIKKGSTVTIYLNGSNRLEGGNNTGIGKNYGYAGICVEEGASLTILGNGSLKVKGGGVKYGAAAIGSNYDEGSGKITIGNDKNAPVITATGGANGAGIGSGRDGKCDDGIYIVNGNITATGGESAAGIGGGKEGYAENINISGGTITAKGGKYGAGIGSGNRVLSGDGGNVKNINITGGIIKATGGESAAGIGGGDQSEVSGLKIEQKSGSKLEITATGGKYGAGIGNGNSGTISRDMGDIYIYLRGGKITATGGNEGAGIGGGSSSAKNIKIYGYGTVTATGYNESSGIGAGENSDCGEIIIEGVGSNRPLTINANAYARDGRTNDAAAIGSASSNCGNIIIKNAIVNADSRYQSDGAAIGTGYKTEMIMKGSKDITIENCEINDRQQRTRRGASIGAGVSSTLENIYIKNSDINVGSIGLSFNGNEVFRESCLNSIKIEGSNVKADSSVEQKAAIGSGAFSSVKLIEIKDSRIDAKAVNGAGIGSGGYSSNRSADYLLWTGGECGEIKISNSVINATGGDGGAGIGGGWGTSVGKITISSSEITAKGGARSETQGGTGIGGGAQEGCGPIYISNSTVVAKGSAGAAGIGTGGTGSITAILWNITCGGISIINSEVEAVGGSNGAGIGTGYGAQFTGGSFIEIQNSKVKATGGDYGAGIGAGSGGSLDRGGEAADINIKGRSMIEARGGAGAAGIGGGFEGGAGTVNIELEDTIRMSSGEWVYYVKAYGGAGAAGIGSGGVNTDNVTFPKNGYDIYSVKIHNGYVYAKGGDKDDKLGKGAGAGIGGGARGGNIDGFYVSGGYVHASAGAGSGDAAADDIGTGGNDVRHFYEDENFYITDGTVIGKLSSDPDKIYIDGGSVKGNTKNAYRTDGTKVYRTQLKVEHPYYVLENLKTNVAGYGNRCVISDGDSKVYLYLPTTQSDKGYADFNFIGKDRHYYGTIDTSGNSWLKMGNGLELELLDTPAVGKSFRAKLIEPETCDVTYYAGGAAGLMDGNVITGEHLTLPGTEIITLYGEDFGEFFVNFTASEESDMYWSNSGTFNGEINKSATTIAVVTDPSKVYDGNPITNPQVKTNSNGKITYTYYDGGVSESNKMNTMPTKAGFYTLIVNVAETDVYDSAQITKTFNIEQRPVTLVMSASQNGNKGTITVEALNAVDADGTIDLDIVKDGGGFVSREINLTKDSNGKFVATIEFDKVSSSNYNVTAQYIKGTNHFCRASVSRGFSKDKAIRTVSHEDIEVTYGDGDIVLSPISSATSTEGDYYEYRIVEGSDEYVTYGLAPTIILDSATGRVEFNRAGKVVIEIVLKEKDDLGNGVEYEDAYTYITVNVKKKDITVTPIVRDDNSSSLDKIEYGKTDSLIYEIQYSGLVGSETFNDTAVGTLEVEKLEKTAGAGIYYIGVKQIGGNITLNGSVYENIFLSRNYNVIVNKAQITIEPKAIYISAKNTEVKYGDMPKFEYELSGLNMWDKAEYVFEEEPVLGFIDLVSEIGGYECLGPGLYENYIEVLDVGIVKDNEKGAKNYIVYVGEEGDFFIDKIDIHAKTESEITVYNGKPVNAVAKLEPAKNLEFDGISEIKYYEVTSEGLEEIEGAPVNVGIYMVEIVAMDSDYYYDGKSRSMIVINKAVPDVILPQLPDMKIHDGLVLEEQLLPKGWTWCYKDKELSLGYVSALAVFTPEDTHNYMTVEAYLDFNVYDESAIVPDEDDEYDRDDEDSKVDDNDDESDDGDDEDSDDKDLDDKDPDGENPDDASDKELDDDSSDKEDKDEDVVETGDTFNPVIWLCVFGLSGLILILSIVNHFKGKK